jgi:GrpB-like predicted nucleotidyltransferase (UPF0157 family)
MSDEIEIVPYDPAWPSLYEAEAALVRAALPADLTLAIEHFGSTAIPGLAAKPVIDILVAVRSIAAARSRVVAPLTALGYAFWADNPKRDRLFFVKGLPPAPRRTHHVHLTEPTGEVWPRLLFRDYLRRHGDARDAYLALKLDLARRFPDDREAYTNGKQSFVDDMMARIRAENFSR